MKYQLRDYQKEASDAAVNFFRTQNDRNGLLICPTGSGKSLIISDVAYRLGEPMLVLQPSREILTQNYDKLRSYGVEDCSIYSASLNSKEISRITFATIGSIMAHIDDFDHFKYIIVDECFPYSQFVSTEIGQQRIGTLYNYYIKGKSLPKVMSYNEYTKSFEPKSIKRVFCNGVRKIVKLTFSSNVKVRCTENHKFLTQRGWVSAGDLMPTDVVYTSSEKGRSSLRLLNDDQKDLILGSIIGDGSLDRRPAKNTYRMKFIHCEQQKDYLLWKHSIMNSDNLIHEITDNGFSHKRAYSFTSSVFFMPSFEATKINAINQITAKSLAVIFMDDGHLDKRMTSATICCVAESSELTSLLVQKLTVMGISCKSAKAKSSYSNKEYNYISINKSGVYALSSLIAPYVHPSMAHKIHPDFRYLCGSYKWDNKSSRFGGLAFQKKENDGFQTVYNLEVEDNHTYLISNEKYDKNNKTYSNGIIVHNCHNVNASQGQYKDFFSKVKRKILGLTATPYRLNSAMQYLDKDGKPHFRPKDDEGSLKFDERLAKRELTMETRCVLKFLTRTRPRVFHDVIYQVDISTLLERGYLAKVEYFDLSVVDQSRLKRNSTGMDFDDRSLSNEFKLNNFGQYLLEIVNRLRSPKNGVPRRGILVFTKYIDECEALCKHLPSCAIVTGSTPKREREEILDNFKAGCIEVLLNVGVLTTGFDYPELDTVVLARPTMSLALYYQIVGRGIRPHPSKKSCWLVDLCGNIKRFGKVEDLHLSQPNPGEYIITGNADGNVKQLTNIYY